jgi:hypothetical protein
MMKIFNGQIVAVLIFIAIFLLGCTHHPNLGSTLNTDEQLITELHSRVLTRIPNAFSSIQLIQVSAGGKQFDLTGYLRMNPGNEFDAIAINEMGLTIFEFQRRGEENYVISKPPGVDDTILQSGPMEDISFLFMKPDCDPSHLSRADSVITLAYHATSGEWIEFLFSSDLQELNGCREILDGKCVREVKYEEMLFFDELGYKIPSQIELIQYDLHYQIEILVHSIDPDD